MENNITIENLKEHIKEIIETNELPNEDGGIEMYLDYRDTLSNSTLYDIMTADNPREYFYEWLSDCEIEGRCYYEDELSKEIRKELSDEEIELFEENEDELRDWFNENWYFYYDSDHYNETVKVNIMLDTGNLNYDCTCDNILNYCGDGEIDKNSSILWLARQQMKVIPLRKAVKESLRNDIVPNDYGKFITSCIEELENLPSHIATLTFLVHMKLFDYFELREAMESEKKLNDSYIFEERKGKGNLTLSKDTMCGLFDVWSGGGSLLEIKLEHNVVLPIKCIWKAEIETGKSQYGYSVDSVYGLVGSAWDGEVEVTHYMKPEEIEKVEKVKEDIL